MSTSSFRTLSLGWYSLINSALPNIFPRDKVHLKVKVQKKETPQAVNKPSKLDVTHNTNVIILNFVHEPS